MTKKHFIDMAKTLKSMKDSMTPMLYRIMCENIADFCSRHGQYFDSLKISCSL